MKINIRTILLAILAAAGVYAASTVTTVDNQIVDMGYKLVDTFYPATSDVTPTTVIVTPTEVK
jgi:hypothetical protein